MTPLDALLLLTHEVVQMRGRGALPGFADFLRDWRATQILRDGTRILSLWHGPAQARLAVLCDSAPDWRVVSVAEYGLSEVWARPQPRHGSFVRPGRPQGHWGDCLCRNGVFLGWWPAVGGAQGLRLIRHDTAVELRAQAGDFVLIDWQDSAPVARFEATDLPGTGWIVTIAPGVPYAAAQLWPAYMRQAALAPEADGTADQWAYSVVSAAAEDWMDVAVRILAVADAADDSDALLRFGAHIYGNDGRFFRRLWAEIDAGSLDPEVVGLILSMERPEYFDPETLAVFRRLQGRCRVLH